ncbi:MAG: DUF1996 domain-containing protein [Rhizobacter sp.]
MASNSAKMRGVGACTTIVAFLAMSACGGGPGGSIADAAAADAPLLDGGSPDAARNTSVAQPDLLVAAAPGAALSSAGSAQVSLSSPMGGPAIDNSRIPPSMAGVATVQVKPTTEVPPNSDIGAFRTACGFSHMAYDDPIVFPGQPGKSHLHAFFGNTELSAATTPESLRSSGASTCRGGIVNRSAYWVPAMIDTATGTPLAPAGGSFYYKQGYEITPSTAIQPLPPGLRMIAGNANNASPIAGPYSFACYNSASVEIKSSRTEIPDCPAGTTGFLIGLNFPQCWDGKNVDSPDHKSHMSGSVQLQKPPFTRSCPPDHPVALPAISFNVWYAVGPSGTRNWRLSSDMYDPKLPGGYSMHGDYFNGWDKQVSDTWAKNCLQAMKDCHSHLLGDGREIY